MNYPMSKYRLEKIRFSIIHAESVNGFVDNALLIKVNEELNGDAFEKWLTTQLLPNLPENPI